MQTCTAMQRTAEPILLVGGLGIWQSFTSRSSEKLYTTGTSYPHTCIARLGTSYLPVNFHLL